MEVAHQLNISVSGSEDLFIILKYSDKKIRFRESMNRLIPFRRSVLALTQKRTFFGSTEKVTINFVNRANETHEVKVLNFYVFVMKNYGFFSLYT